MRDKADWNRLQRLTDIELADIALNHDHPDSETAEDVLDYRASCNNDPRVAQAMGY